MLQDKDVVIAWDSKPKKKNVSWNIPGHGDMTESTTVDANDDSIQRLYQQNRPKSANTAAKARDNLVRVRPSTAMKTRGSIHAKEISSSNSPGK